MVDKRLQIILRLLTLPCCGFNVALAQWSSGHLSTERISLAGTLVRNTALFGGGRNGPASAVVDVLDTATGQWSTATLSVPRSYLAATSLGNLAAFAGGRDGGGTPIMDVVDLFDVTTGKWSVEHLPLAAMVHSATSVGDFMIFAGGFGVAGTLGIAQLYNVTTGTWSTAPLSFPRAGIGAATHGDRAYFVGGGATQPHEEQTVDIFDASTGSWSVLTMADPHPYPAVTIAEGTLFATRRVGFETAVDLYDIDQGTWKTTFLPVGRQGPTAGSVGPYAIFVGGLDFNTGLGLATADVYDVRTGEWMTFDLTEPICCGTVAQNGHVVIFAGGQSSSMGPTDTVDIFDPGIGELGTNYCGPANFNSSGQSARMVGSGVSLASANFVWLDAYRLPPGQFGYFLTGDGQSFIPFVGGSQGNLCLGGRIGRYAKNVLSSGSSGHFSLKIDLESLPTTPAHQVLAGETWNFQAWFRDKNPGRTSNFTDGLSIVFR